MQKECPICHGLYYGDDIINHRCNQCTYCSKPFDNHPNPKKEPFVKRYNDIDRFKPYYNACETCATHFIKSNSSPPSKAKLQIQTQSKLTQWLAKK